MSNAFSFCDDLGPFKVIHVHVPRHNVKGTDLNPENWTA